MHMSIPEPSTDDRHITDQDILTAPTHQELRNELALTPEDEAASAAKLKEIKKRRHMYL